MKLNKLHNIKNGVIALAVTLFFSCTNNFKEVNKIGVSENEPQGVGVDINVIRTDSGRVAANLISPKLLDFENRKFGYSEFPEGVILHIFDEQNQRTTIVSDYAIIYSETDVIDLQDNVIVSTHEGDSLYADQLFFDQKKEWLFTNLPVKYKSKDYLTKGQGFDSDRDFTKAEVLEISGVFAVSE
ncbi:LPS export ABC transporter protein LptC [Lacinutrix venerupis]|uniref:LPS export ABC transporter periplasmic protein LptC n=1 Tax=Lacinutrix venerupis TaxID=1486034 RepID=A0AAC9LLY1_9FLAO|nr:LPS export ABC transporter periplasmic protein LptC [Lacinutrix venerupis]APY01281.1 LPS export ABC transporter periplasmic protein LptC [Lacinutrix venerupis]RLJ67457.1 LPS export ABC transporter protein LptC [Lacinutrix venerupis]